MKIVVLDGATLTTHQPGHLCPSGEPDWAQLEALGELTVHPRTAPGDTASHIGDAEVAITNKVVIDDAIMEACPNLKYIGLLSTGTNSVDLPAAAARGIAVSHIPDYSTPSVVQHTFALILELTQKISQHNAAVHKGHWAKHPDFCFTLAPIPELAGKSIGIIGLGNIGRGVAKLADALGMHLLANSRSQPDLGLPIQFLELDALFAQSDVLVLCCPLLPETRHLVSRERLGMMKPAALLINCARGPLVNENALAEALRSGTIAGAGLDVLRQEPPSEDHPLIGCPNCIITPHVAWASVEARGRCLSICTDNLKAWQAGASQNRVES